MKISIMATESAGVTRPHITPHFDIFPSYPTTTTTHNCLTPFFPDIQTEETDKTGEDAHWQRADDVRVQRSEIPRKMEPNIT